MIRHDEYPPTFWERRTDRQLKIFVLVTWWVVSGTALNWLYGHFF